MYHGILTKTGLKRSHAASRAIDEIPPALATDMLPEIARQPLRKAVESELVKRLYQGELEAGDRINESNLAEELGVSRTPLREALLELSFRGFLSSSSNKGFFVRELDRGQAEQLYTLTGALERRAVEATEEFTTEQLEELHKLNEQRRAAMDSPQEAVALDTEWHLALTGECRNDVLLELLTFLKDRLYRFEYKYASDAERIERSVAEHDEIVAALDGHGEAITEAAHLVEQHWATFGHSIRERLGIDDSDNHADS